MFELFFIGFCYIILIIAIFYLTSANYSTLVKAPFYVVILLLFTYVTYVVAGFFSTPPGADPGEKKQLFEIFQRFSYIYGEYILIILGVFFLFLVVYKLFIEALTYSLTKSVWITFGLIILVLALIKNSFYESEPDSKVVAFIKDIIFYIPCLITDSIEFIKKDYSETPTTTFIVFILIIIYCCIFFLVPLINTDGGFLIVSGPQTLDMVTTVTTKEIIENEKYVSDYTNKDFSYNSLPYSPPVKVQLYPRDKITQGIEVFTNKEDVKETFTNKETFTSLVEKDTYYDLGKKQSNIDACGNIYEFDVKEVYKEVSKTTGTYFSKLYSGYKSFTDLFVTTDMAQVEPSMYKYNYGLSFWLYINTMHFKKIAPQHQQIVKYGDKLNMVYDNTDNELIVILEGDQVYKSKEILYQKWNHVVINVGTKVDLFINNNLVGTNKYKNASVVDLYDSLIIGSIKNSNFGSVCNFRYYNKSLDLSKIKSIYTKYNKKNPPI